MKRNWRELCLAVISESDSTKLTSLVEELIEAFDRERALGAVRQHIQEHEC